MSRGTRFGPKTGSDFQRNTRKGREQSGTKKGPECKNLVEKNLEVSSEDTENLEVISAARVRLPPRSGA